MHTGTVALLRALALPRLPLDPLKTDVAVVAPNDVEDDRCT
jgi:hypothetical protein